MDFLAFFTNYKQDYRLQNVIKFDMLICVTFEIIIDFSMHSVYWDTLYKYSQSFFFFWNFVTAENKVVLNSYLVGIVACSTESIKAIYRVIWIIDFL